MMLLESGRILPDLMLRLQTPFSGSGFQLGVSDLRISATDIISAYCDSLLFVQSKALS